MKKFKTYIKSRTKIDKDVLNRVALYVDDLNLFMPPIALMLDEASIIGDYKRVNSYLVETITKEKDNATSKATRLCFSIEEYKKLLDSFEEVEDIDLTIYKNSINNKISKLNDEYASLLEKIKKYNNYIFELKV